MQYLAYAIKLSTDFLMYLRLIFFDSLFAFAAQRSRRGHRFHLLRNARSFDNVLHSFKNKVVRIWNSLSENVMDFGNLAVFMYHLNRFNLHTAASIVY